MRVSYNVREVLPFATLEPGTVFRFPGKNRLKMIIRDAPRSEEAKHKVIDLLSGHVEEPAPEAEADMEVVEGAFVENFFDEN